MSKLQIQLSLSLVESESFIIIQSLYQYLVSVSTQKGVLGLKRLKQWWHLYLSVLGLSWGDSSGLALPRILFLASAYSASRWARDLTCGVGLLWFRGDPKEPLVEGRFKMRIWGGGAAGRESSWITMAVLSGDREELLLDTLWGYVRKHWFVFLHNDWIPSQKATCLKQSYRCAGTLTFLSGWSLASLLISFPFPVGKQQQQQHNHHQCVLMWKQFCKYQASESLMETLGTVTGYLYVPIALAKSRNSQHNHQYCNKFPLQMTQTQTQQLTLLTVATTFHWEDIRSCNLSQMAQNGSLKKWLAS